MIPLLAQEVRVIDGFGVSEFAGHTNLHPVGAAITGVASMLTLLLPRRWAYAPSIILACFLSQGQQIAILGLNFHLLRIYVVFAAIRVLVRNEHMSLRPHTLDALIVAFAASRTIIYTALYGDLTALVFQMGQNLDVIGLYFTTRCLIRSKEDLVESAKLFAIASLPVAMFFVIERSTGHNVFSVFGGVSELTVTRDGKLRCQGPFAHPILAGCFWASLMPLFVVLWWRSMYGKVLAVASTTASLVIVLCCNSSTPVAGVMFGCIGGVFFVMRRHMLAVRIAVAVSLVGLHMAMKAPVWHLISRVSLADGSTSYFRFMLIDSAIHHFGEWALLGTKSTAHWFWGGQDVTNQYILEGVRGGVLTLLIFVGIIWTSFCSLGRLRRRLEHRRSDVFLVWAVGVSLFVHCANYIGISYFGQTILVWYFTLGAVGSLYEEILPQKSDKARSLVALG